MAVCASSFIATDDDDDDDDDDDVIKVSKPLSSTRSSYLFIVIDGQLSAYSLITGQKLLRLDYYNSLQSDGNTPFLALYAESSSHFYLLTSCLVLLHCVSKNVTTFSKIH